MAWSIDGEEIRRATDGIPSPDPDGKGVCAKIKYILHPAGGGGFSGNGSAHNHVRYVSYNRSSLYEEQWRAT